MVAIALYKKAIKGDVRAIGELLDRAEGKPRQSLDLTAAGEFGFTNMSLEEMDRRLMELLRGCFQRQLPSSPEKAIS